MKKILVIFILILSFVIAMPTSILAEGDSLDFVVDGADLITDEEEASLEERIEMLTDHYKMHIVIVTVNDPGYDRESYADSVYRTGGYGYGKEKSCIILLLSMNKRYCDIYTYGEANDKFAQSDIDEVLDAIAPYFSENRYYDGFVSFIDACDNVLTFDFFGSFMIAAIIGIVVALIIVFVMKSKLKSVRPQKNASNYVRSGSFNVTKNLDFYLYRTVTRVRRAENSSRSSGGGARGGGRGGKF